MPQLVSVTISEAVRAELVGSDVLLLSSGLTDPDFLKPSGGRYLLPVLSLSIVEI